MDNMKVYGVESVPALGRTLDQNEDMAGASKFGAWVIDGATSVSEALVPNLELNLVRLFVKQIHESLTDKLDDLQTPISQILRRVLLESLVEIAAVLKPYSPDIDNLKPHQLPRASIAVIRIVGNVLEFFIIGDCVAYIESDFQSIALEHYRSKIFDQELLSWAKSKRNVSQEMPFQELRKKIIEPKLRELRDSSPKEDILRVLTLNPRSIDYATSGTITLKDSRILLMTDGVARAVNTYSLYHDYHLLLDDIASSELGTVISRIRKVEQEDPECREFFRLKVSDDATAITLRHTQPKGELTSEEKSRLNEYILGIKDQNPLTPSQSIDMQELSQRAVDSDDKEMMNALVVGVLGVAAGIGIAILGKVLYDMLVSKEE